jgi:hypothetical protein
MGKPQKTPSETKEVKVAVNVASFLVLVVLDVFLPNRAIP